MQGRMILGGMLGTILAVPVSCAVKAFVIHDPAWASLASIAIGGIGALIGMAVSVATAKG